MSETGVHAPFESYAYNIGLYRFLDGWLIAKFSWMYILHTSLGVTRDYRTITLASNDPFETWQLAQDIVFCGKVQ